MNITRNDTPTAKGPSDWFTGDVYIDTIRTADEKSVIGAAHVHFTPGARTHWHTHPHGQTLYVTDGTGYICTRDGGPQLIRPGDTVHIGPNEEHWHGATPDHFMAHVAMQQADETGSPVVWGEPVNDEEYRR